MPVSYKFSHSIWYIVNLYLHLFLTLVVCFHIRNSVQELFRLLSDALDISVFGKIPFLAYIIRTQTTSLSPVPTLILPGKHYMQDQSTMHSKSAHTVACQAAAGERQVGSNAEAQERLQVHKITVVSRIHGTRAVPFPIQTAFMTRYHALMVIMNLSYPHILFSNYSCSFFRHERKQYETLALNIKIYLAQYEQLCEIICLKF